MCWWVVAIEITSFHTHDYNHVNIHAHRTDINFTRPPLSSPPLNAELSIVKQSDSHDEDVTNRAVTVSLNAMGIKFMAISSTPNPFPDMIPEWIFKDGEALPHGVNQKGLNLVFDSILKSQEQKGTYTITFGNYSAFFELQTQGNYNGRANTLK